MEGTKSHEPPDDGSRQRPTVIIVVGMAGSGKTTFMRALNGHLKAKTQTETSQDEKARSRIYTINLDPAARTVPFPCNIDIRDSVKYKEVMKNYNLGPNGAIMTCLNLFATRFHSVLELLEKRSSTIDYILIDTPGQIEVFNWSASGTIILDSLASLFPVVVSYMVDTVRCERAVTFMSNMLYACSVLYKTKLPFVTCFNKIDVSPHQECLKWMTDYDSFAESVLKEETYMASLSRSCSLALAEFYHDLRTVGVSSATGEGFGDFIGAVEACRREYLEQYIPWLEHNKGRLREKAEKKAAQEQKRLARDLGGPAADKECDDDEDGEVEDDEIDKAAGGDGGLLFAK